MTVFAINRVNTLTGAILLIWVVLSILTFVFPVTDANPLERGEIEGMLRDISSHQAQFVAFSLLEAAANGVLLIILGALLYLVFRDRNRIFALLGGAGLFAAGILYAVYVAGNLALVLLADDFVRAGGAGGLPTGAPETIEVARGVAVFAAMAWLAAATAFSLGLMGFGTMLASLSREEVSPPRWLGGVAIASGLLVIAHAAVLGNEFALELLYAIGYLGILVTLTVLGIWLLRHGGHEFVEKEVLAQAPVAAGGRA